MKRNLFSLLCIMLLTALCLASCGCDHTFSDEWYSDETHHWHPATCEHAETERGDYAPHVDADEDSVCDVCAGHVGHVHTYESAWQFDDTHHWQNPTCSHTENNETYGLHSDEDMNGYCDACEGHVHNLNGAGYCKFDYCGEKVKDIDETSLDDIINAVYLQAYLINGGTVDYDFIGRSNTGADYEATKNQNIVYQFGKDNYTYTKVTTNSVNAGVSRSDVQEGWYQLDGVDQVFGVVSLDGGALELDLPEVARLNGYHIDLSDLAGDYGVESALYALYEAAIADTTTDLEVIPDPAENKVVFKYNYKTFILNESNIVHGDNAGSKVYNLHYYEAEVELRYDDDFALISLEIKLDCYTSDPGTADGYGFLYHDVDIIYDPETDTVNFVEYVYEDGEWVAYPTDKRTPDTYTVSVTQTVGDRTESNPNPKSKFIPNNFDLYLERSDDTGELSNKLKGDLSVTEGDIINLYIGDCIPEGTSLHFVADQVTFKLYKDGAEVPNPDDYLNQTAVAMFTFAGSQRSFFVIPKETGTYRFEIYLCGKLIRTVNIYAGVVNVEDVVLKDNQFAVAITESNAWVHEVTFTATTTGTYYFNLPAGIGFVDADAYDKAEATPDTGDSPLPYFDFNNANDPATGKYIPGSFSLKLEAGQTIRFYVNGYKKGTYIIEWFTV